MNHFSLFGSLLYIYSMYSLQFNLLVLDVFGGQRGLYGPVQAWLGTPPGQEHMHAPLNFQNLLCAHWSSFFGCFCCLLIQCHGDIGVQLYGRGGATRTYSCKACRNGIMPQCMDDTIRDRLWSVLKSNYPSFCCLLISWYPLTWPSSELLPFRILEKTYFGTVRGYFTCRPVRLHGSKNTRLTVLFVVFHLQLPLMFRFKCESVEIC